MRWGTIVEAARGDNRFWVWASGLLTLACIVVLAVHARYLYNWVAGPFAVDTALLDEPGWRQFVRAEGELTHSGVVEETSRRRLRGLIETSRQETAEFFTLPLGDRALVVKVPRDFAGNVVEGRLVETPDRLRDLVDRDQRVHDWMIDAEHSYRREWNVALILLALVLILPCARWLVRAVKRARSFLHHDQIAALAAHGDPVKVVDAIEREMAEFGQAANVGPYWISPSWLVRPRPLLVIVHARDVAGVAARTRKVKDGERHEIRLWRRGQSSAADDTMSAAETAAVAARIAACMPWAVVSDAEEFERRWDADRAAQEAAAQARYESHVGGSAHS